MDYKYQGIILSALDVAEADRIYTIYAKEAGKIRVLGKGVRRPNAKLAGLIEPLTHADIFIARSRGLGKITGAVVLDNFSSLKSNFETISRVFPAVAIFQKIISDQESDQKVFALLLAYLETMEKMAACRDETVPHLYHAETLDIVSLGFLFKLLGRSGYALQVEKCVVCGGRLSPERNFFSAERGGIVCGACTSVIRTRISVRSGAIKIIRLALANEIGNLGKIKAAKSDIDNARMILNEEVKWIVG